MKLVNSINRKVAGALVLAITGGGLFLGAGTASAAGTAPSWEPDPNSAGYGTLSFYNAQGAQITSGTSLSKLFDYAVASTDSPRTGTNKATLFFGFPDHTKADTITWFSSQSGAASTFPVSGAPGDVANAGNHPVLSVGAGGADLNSALGAATLDQTVGYKDIVQIRLRDSGAGKPVQSGFWGADIMYNQAAGTWTQVYPAVVTATNTTLTATPSPSTVGDTVTLKATVTPTAAGTVQFKDGAATIGAAVPVNAGGIATTTTSTLAAGSHSLSAVFAPTTPADFGASTGTATVQVNPPATPTSTVLALSGAYTEAGKPATLTANVTGPGTTPNGAGTVAFYDNGATAPIAGTVTTPATGTYVLDLPTGFTAGAHSVVAKFTPTSTSQFQVSQSAAQAFTTSPAAGDPCAQPGSACIDPQAIQATVPVGTLVINTPYTAANPLDVGTLALSADSTKFTGSATFQNIKITDTRAGNLPWTATALSTALSNGSNRPNGVINAQNVGLTNLVANGTGFTGNVAVTANPAASAVGPTDAGSAGLGGSTAHTIATADHGLGTVTMNGVLTIQAPSSTEQGLYTGTITFTVG